VSQVRHRGPLAQQRDHLPIAFHPHLGCSWRGRAVHQAAQYPGHCLGFDALVLEDRFEPVHHLAEHLELDVVDAVQLACAGCACPAELIFHDRARLTRGEQSRGRVSWPPVASSPGASLQLFVVAGLVSESEGRR
jgi:hypothetical protein